MRGKILLVMTTLTISTLSLAGCGGSGGGAAPAPAVGTINRGAVTASGNILVNGVFYNISSANINIDGLPGKKSDLQAGMVVTVRGVFGNLTSHAIRRAATSVEYISNFQGPVDCVNILNNTLTIMGQNVLISSAPPNQTVFANFSSRRIIFSNVSTVVKLNPRLSPQLLQPDQLADPDPDSATYNPNVYSMVKVSGFSNDISGFQATRVELIAQSVDLTTSFPIAMMGTANNVDPIGMAFTIGNLSIDYSQMNQVYVPIHFASGQFIGVKGFSSDYSPGNAPTLSVIAPRSIFSTNEGAVAQQGDHVAVAGFVSGLSGTSFKVGGTPVSTNTISLKGIANSVLVEVEGVINNGVLIATKLTLL
jgi:hypothetical protein